MMHKDTTEGRLVKIETRLDYITEKTDDINQKLDKFIESADRKYATKEEMKIMKAQVAENTRWIVKYGKDIAYLSAFVLLFAKTQGWI